MAALALSARLVLAAVLVGASAGKWRDRSGLAVATRAFGVPVAAARLVAAVLGPAEVAAAVLLVAGYRAGWTAWPALGLLSAFAAGVVVNLLRGRRPPCPCFGSPSATRPISGRTLARSAWLCGLAVVAGGSTTGASAGPVLAMGFALGALTLATLRAAR